jgi:hypothetical protein
LTWTQFGTETKKLVSNFDQPDQKSSLKNPKKGGVKNLQRFRLHGFTVFAFCWHSTCPTAGQSVAGAVSSIVSRVLLLKP